MNAEMIRAAELQRQLFEVRDQMKGMLGPAKWAAALREFRPYLATIAANTTGGSWLAATIELCKRLERGHAPAMMKAKALAVGAEFAERNETP